MSVDIPGVPELCTAGERSDLDLALSVVEYGDHPDRCTVYPPGLTGDARLSLALRRPVGTGLASGAAISERFYSCETE
jgi:hypothetical protein